MKKNKLQLKAENAEFISGFMTHLTGVDFKPRIDTPNNLLQYSYIFDNEIYVDENVEGPNHKELIINSIVYDSGKDIREYAIAKKMGLYSNEEQNGVDAYEIKYDNLIDNYKIDKTWELKTQRLRKNSLSKTGVNKISGVFSVSSKSIKHINSIDDWLDKNDKLAMSGWVNGKVAFIISFTIKDSGMRKHIIYRLNNGAKLNNGGISFGFESYKDTPDLKLEYINPIICTKEFIVDTLYDKIQELYEKSFKKPLYSDNKRGLTEIEKLQKHIDIVNMLDRQCTTKEISELTKKSKSTISRIKKIYRKKKLV